MILGDALASFFLKESEKQIQVGEVILLENHVFERTQDLILKCFWECLRTGQNL